MSQGYTLPGSHQDDPTRIIIPLMNDIRDSVNILQKTVKLVGTKADTEDERKKFWAMVNDVRQKTQQVTKILSKMEVHNYEIETELYSHTTTFRTTVAQFKSKSLQFKPFKPSNFTETVPLLSSKQFNPTRNNYPYKYNKNGTINSQEKEIFDNQYMTNLKIHDETQMLEEKESKMQAIQDDLEDVNEMFLDLRELAEDANEPIANLQQNVISISDNMKGANNELVKAQKMAKKARRNRCLLLFILLTALVALICMFWAVKHK